MKRSLANTILPPFGRYASMFLK